jgi:hypothetical protein
MYIALICELVSRNDASSFSSRRFMITRCRWKSATAQLFTVATCCTVPISLTGTVATTTTQPFIVGMTLVSFSGSRRPIVIQ